MSPVSFSKARARKLAIWARLTMRAGKYSRELVPLTIPAAASLLMLLSWALPLSSWKASGGFAGNVNPARSINRTRNVAIWSRRTPFEGP